MDIHVLCYGLGNQLSQYAFFINRRKLNQNSYAFYAFKQHNGYELGRIFGLREGLPWYLKFLRVLFRLGISRRFYSGSTVDAVLSLFRIKIVTESDDYGFDPILLKPWRGIRILFGGWHDPRYFHPSEDAIRNAYSFSELDEINNDVLQQINITHSISIHVRRGDYLRGKNAELFGNITTIDYYRSAIKWVREFGVPSGAMPTFFVFSDDIGWCQENFDLGDAVFVSGNSGDNSWKDMALMSACRINIIANSTFSWWAAWLNKHSDKKVLCPTKFINTDTPGKNIYPTDWIQISS